MIIDTSAIIAILRGEPDGRAFAAALENADDVRISAANFLEAAIIADRVGEGTISGKFDALCLDLSLEIVAVDERQARIAREAYRDFGKGSGHPAKLNFGDCFAYALAKATVEPLLFKGTDFSKTDVTSALP